MLGDKDEIRAAFGDDMEQLHIQSECENLDDYNSCVNRAFMVAASSSLPAVRATAQRPWIQGRTLELIDARNVARRSADHNREVVLNRAIGRMARRDREIWLNDLAPTRDWGQLRKLRKGKSTNDPNREPLK